MAVNVCKGHVDGLSDVLLKVFYLPRSPGQFKQVFSIRVGHFEPDTIHLYGEAIYANVTLELPRDHKDQYRGGYAQLLDQAVDNVTRRIDILDPSTSSHKDLLPFHHALLNTGHLPATLARKVSIEDYFKAGYSAVRTTPCSW